jgi:thiol-disulfide isomerase/thioredoxin/YHS domain-containing protein
MRLVVRSGLAAWVALACATAWGADQKVRWQSDVAAAQRLAAHTNRLVLLHFWAPWCEPCREVEARVFTDDGVAQIVDQYYVPVKLNIDHNVALAKKYKVESIPADVIITPQGQLVDKAISPQQAAGYVAKVSQMAIAAQRRPGGTLTAGVTKKAPPDQPAAAANVNPAKSPRSPYADLLPPREAKTAATAPRYGQQAPYTDQAVAPTSVRPTAQPVVPPATAKNNSGLGPRYRPSELAAHDITVEFPGASGPFANPPVAQPTRGDMAGDVLAADRSPAASESTGPAAERVAPVPPQGPSGSPLVGSRYQNWNLPGGPEPEPPAEATSPPQGNLSPAVMPPQPAEVAVPSVRRGPPSSAAVNQPAFLAESAPAKNAPTPAASGDEPAAGVDALASKRAAQVAAPRSRANGFGSGLRPAAASDFATATVKDDDPSASPSAAPPTVTLPPGVPPLGFFGFCPVTMAHRGQWVAGDPRWGVIHRGRTYLFTSEENKNAFFSDPDRYAPVLSGYDVVHYLTRGVFVPGKAEYGVFYKGLGEDDTRVYLFSSEDTLRRFQENFDDLHARIQQALQRDAALRR